MGCGAGALAGGAQAQHLFRYALDNQHAVAVPLHGDRHTPAHEVEGEFVHAPPADRSIGGLHEDGFVQRAPHAGREAAVDACPTEGGAIGRPQRISIAPNWRVPRSNAVGSGSRSRSCATCTSTV